MKYRSLPAAANGPAKDGRARLLLGHRSRSDLVRSPWWSLVLLVGFTFLGPEFLAGSRYFSTMVLAGVWGIAVVGLGMLSGYAGQISLGQAAIVGVGSYGSAIAVVRWGLPPIAGVGVGLLFTLVVALGSSPILRLRGLYFALGTLVLGLLIGDLLTNLSSWTGGSNGFVAIPAFSVAGYTFNDDSRAFVLVWAVLTVSVGIAANVNRSRVGRALMAIREDEDAARSLGVRVTRYKVGVWLFAAGLASIAGSLYAHVLQYISPGQFGLGQSVVLLAAVVLGGMSSRLGPVLAISFLMILPDLTQGTAITGTLASGVLLVVVMTVYPGGLGAIWEKLTGRLLGWQKAEEFDGA